MASPKPAAPKPIPRELRSSRLPALERRAQLLRVAIDLFSRKGFKGTTTREIASASGVTEALIFRHFRTKEDLYTAIIDQRLNSPNAAAWIADFRAAMERGDDKAVIRQLIDAVICTHREDPKFERLMLHAALEGNGIALIYMRQVTAAIVDSFRSYFLRRQEQGRLRAIGSEAALMAIVGMAQHFALGKYIHGVKELSMTDEQAIEGFTEIAMHGLCVNAAPAKARTK